MGKRLLALCLTFAMPLSLAACGGGGDAPSGTPTRGPSPRIRRGRELGGVLVSVRQ